MSFIEVSVWERPSLPTVRGVDSHRPSVLAPLLALALRRPLGFACSIAVHLVLLIIYLNLPSPMPTVRQEQGQLSVFSLSVDTPAEKKGSEGGVQAASQQASKLEQQPDPVPPTPTPAPEWSMSAVRFKTPVSTASVAVSATGAQSGATSQGKSSGQSGGGGGGGFDPYAGASPQRPGDATYAGGSGTSSFGVMGCVIDMAAIEQVRRAVSQRLKGLKGIMRLQVRTNERGQVSHIDVLQQDVGSSAVMTMLSLLDGKKVCQGATVLDGIITPLPPIAWH